MNRRIAVIGTIVRDRIRFQDNKTRHSWGGLFYSLSSVLALMDKTDTLFPISYVGVEAMAELIRLNYADPRIDLSGLVVTDQENNRVDLHYTSPAERTEYSLNPFPALRYEHIRASTAADIIIINMISGWDIDRETLHELRRHSKALIAIDLHSLTLGRDQDGRRYRRTFDAVPWIEPCDIVQCNEHEFVSIGGDLQNPQLFYRHACVEGRQVINLTLASQGSITMTGNQKNFKMIHTGAPSGIMVVDPTGCGDAFLAAFTIEYYHNKTPGDAAKRANLLAGLSGSFKGLPEPDRLRRKLNRFLRKIE
jgi:sugar/nucleoside kinase (ribokinase family)